MYLNIEAERARKNLTQKELAEMLNVSCPTYRAWVKKKRKIPGEKLALMSKIFNCSVDYLLESYDVKKGA